MPQRTSRGTEYKWVNPKKARNEVLDCTVYAIFCTHAIGLHTYTDRMWSKLEEAVQPANADLFAISASNTSAASAGSYKNNSESDVETDIEDLSAAFSARRQPGQSRFSRAW